MKTPTPRSGPPKPSPASPSPSPDFDAAFDATLTSARTIAAAAGTLTLTGYDATLTHLLAVPEWRTMAIPAETRIYAIRR